MYMNTQIVDIRSITPLSWDRTSIADINHSQMINILMIIYYYNHEFVFLLFLNEFKLVCF